MSLPNPGMDFTAGDVLPASDLDKLVENIEALSDGSGQNTASITGAKIAADTVEQTNLHEKMPEYTFDFVASGCVWSGDAYGSTRNASCTSGVVYLNGVRLTVAAVVARAFTASKDVYCDLSDNGDGTASWNYTDNTTNAASPALTAGRLRGAIIVVGAANIANVGSVNMGEENKVLPIASSTPYAVTDSLGNLICPRDPNRKILGYRQIVADFNSSAANTQITGLTCPVIAPTNRKIKITVWAKNWRHTSSPQNITLSIWDGAAGSGTEVGRAFATIAGTNYSLPVSLSRVVMPTTASKTYNAALGSAATSTIEGGATYPAYIMVELV